MKALVRSSDNKVLTNIGQIWNPVQNEEAFEFFSEYVLAGDMEMHTAGSLKGGQMVWALAKVKESFDLFGGDKVESYLLFSNPHLYGKSIDIRFTPIRVVCNNTLSLSLEQQAERSIGMATQKLTEVLFNQNLGFGLELQGVEMDYFSSEIAAYNQLPPPPRPEQASFLPYVPILDPGPSKPVKREPNYFAAFLGGAAAGVGAFGQAGGAQPAPAPKGKTP